MFRALSQSIKKLMRLVTSEPSSFARLRRADNEIKHAKK